MKKIIVMVIVSILMLTMIPVAALAEESEYEHLPEDAEVVMIWNYEVNPITGEGTYVPTDVFRIGMYISLEEVNEAIDDLQEFGHMYTIEQYDENGNYNLIVWDPDVDPSPIEFGLVEE